MSKAVEGTIEAAHGKLIAIFKIDGIGYEYTVTPWTTQTFKADATLHYDNEGQLESTQKFSAKLQGGTFIFTLENGTKIVGAVETPIAQTVSGTGSWERTSA